MLKALGEEEEEGPGSGFWLPGKEEEAGNFEGARQMPVAHPLSAAYEVS